MTFPVIDLFAGPGGLGEGFSSYTSGKEFAFKIALSIEKDKFAHQTLELRAFYRQFPREAVPMTYYEYLKGGITKDELFAAHPLESANAKREAWHAELGSKKTDPKMVAARVEAALNGAEKWVLIGGPPCQAYSVVGRSILRSRSKIKYAKDRRHFLYKEYLKILAEHQPPIFVMENVKGLLSSQRIKGQNTFDLIIADLKKPLNAKRSGGNEDLAYKLFSLSKKAANGEEFEPDEFVVRSEEYGIPQARHRVIILGIRSDFYKTLPKTLAREETLSINEVIDDLPKLRSGLSKEVDTGESWQAAICEIKKAGWLETVSSDLQIAILASLEEIHAGLPRGSSFITKSTQSGKTPKLAEWYIDKNLEGVCNHETRSHIRSDLHRYFFASVFAKTYGRSPTLRDFPKDLLPKHHSVQAALEGSNFNDRFRVQVSGKPSTTVISHISKDGHYYIHYDPSQCRSLTVREAARLQTFPDNYFFEGNRTQQYHQVGNAVPPLLAYKIAEIVYNILKDSE